MNGRFFQFLDNFETSLRAYKLVPEVVANVPENAKVPSLLTFDNLQSDKDKEIYRDYTQRTLKAQFFRGELTDPQKVEELKLTEVGIVFFKTMIGKEANQRMAPKTLTVASSNNDNKWLNVSHFDDDALQLLKKQIQGIWGIEADGEDGFTMKLEPSSKVNNDGCALTIACGEKTVTYHLNFNTGLVQMELVERQQSINQSPA